MIVELLQGVATQERQSDTSECIVTIICNLLRACEVTQEISQEMGDDVIMCNPLINMVQALTNGHTTGEGSHP